MDAHISLIYISFYGLYATEYTCSCHRLLLLFLNFGQTQRIKVYSPGKLIFNFYSPPTFSVILQYNLVILLSQIRSSLFGHLNNS